MAKVEFRDGEREIPDYLATIMSGIETYRLSYEEALAEANRKLLNDKVEMAFTDILHRHFQEPRAR